MSPQNPAPLINPYLELYRALESSTSDLRLQLRKKLIWAYAWALPGEEAIRAIAAHGKIIDWGAGTGYWSWLLEQAGAKVRTFDSAPEQPPHWHSVEKADETALKALKDHVLLLCWPPFESDMASRALDAYTGETVIYVGEWEGRTANIEFHQKLSKGWTKVSELPIPRWPGFYDRVFTFQRKSS